MSVESIDAHLCESAILAVVLHTHTGLIAQSLSKTRGTYHVKHLIAQHTHKRAAVAAFHFALVAGDHHLLKHHHVFYHLKVYIHRTFHVNGLALRHKTYSAHLYGVASVFHIFELEVPCFVRVCTVSGTGENHR